MKEMICIVCPVGCHMSVDANMNVFNNKCKRGEVYAKKELTNPTRMVTSTVRVKSTLQNRVSVKTTDAIPKGKIFELMSLLTEITLEAPIQRGHVVIENVFDTGVDIVTTASLNA